MGHRMSRLVCAVRAQNRSTKVVFENYVFANALRIATDKPTCRY